MGINVFICEYEYTAMGSYTPNIGLYKPDIGELNWGERVNQNFDILDEKIHEIMSVLQQPLKVIQTREQAIIDGKAYYAYAVFRGIPNGGYVSMLFVNPSNSGSNVKIDTVIIKARYDAELTIYQNPTVNSYGVKLTSFVFNLDNIIPPKAEVYRDSDFTGGLITLEDIILGGHTKDAVGETSRYNNFVIVPPNTIFGLRLQNISGQTNDFSVRIEWREEY